MTSGRRHAQLLSSVRALQVAPRVSSRFLGRREPRRRFIGPDAWHTGRFGGPSGRSVRLFKICKAKRCQPSETGKLFKGVGIRPVSRLWTIKAGFGKRQWDILNARAQDCSGFRGGTRLLLKAPMPKPFISRYDPIKRDQFGSKSGMMVTIPGNSHNSTRART